jgi:hypothetical protein
MEKTFVIAGAIILLLEASGSISPRILGLLPVGGSHIAQIGIVFALAFVVSEITSVAPMTVQNRISVSFNDEEFLLLERLSSHTQKTKAELIRIIVEEFLRDNPNRFRRETPMGLRREKNLILPHETK